LAVAVRPEIFRRTDCAEPESGYGCGPFPPGQEQRATEPGKQRRTASTSSVFIGIELGEKPGGVLNGIWWVAAGVIAIGLASAGH
jgi:hypothetical protein